MGICPMSCHILIYKQPKETLGPPPLSHHYSMDGEQCKEMKTEQSVLGGVESPDHREPKGHTQGSIWSGCLLVSSA